MAVFIEKVCDQVVLGCGGYHCPSKFTRVCGSVGQDDLPIDIRGLSPPPTFEEKVGFFTQPVDQNLELGADPLLQASGIKLPLSSQEFALSFFHNLVRHKVGSSTGRSALFVRIRKYTEMIG